MRSANAVFKAMCSDCAAFGSLWDDAVASQYYVSLAKPGEEQRGVTLKSGLLRALADELEKEGDI
jgi:hypothetical protein